MHKLSIRLVDLEVGIERKHAGARILAANKDLLTILATVSHLSESRTWDEILTHLRGRIALGDLSGIPYFMQRSLCEHREHFDGASLPSAVAANQRSVEADNQEGNGPIKSVPAVHMRGSDAPNPSNSQRSNSRRAS